MRIKIPVKIIELEPGNFHIKISAEFQDKTTGAWVIDTGASKSVFDLKLEKLFEVSETETETLHSAGISEEPIQTKTALLKPFHFGKLHVSGFRVALLDLTHINKLYANSANTEICGLLGGDFLMKYKAVIDYKKSAITFFV